MTSPACAAEGLRPRFGADGSFSLWSETYGEGFHSPAGALEEARCKVVLPARLERFSAGDQLQVVDVGFGLGTNSAALLEAASGRHLRLQIWGLELDRQPLRQAMAAAAFRQQWQPHTMAMLAALLEQGRWRGSQQPVSTARLLWGDARRRVNDLLEGHARAGGCDLVLLDAFSPRRCPQLWSLEFLAALARLLRPDGLLLTYSCAAAVRAALQLVGLHLASIRPQPGPLWSFGTAASPSPILGADSFVGALQPLTAMEIEHLGTRAAEPYRDPDGQGSSVEILAARQRAQAASAAGSTSAWRRRWQLQPRGTAVAEASAEPT
ncbi:MAG: MnmC family methyltransferase [Cyanobacteria bacterium J06638_7]